MVQSSFQKFITKSYFKPTTQHSIPIFTSHYKVIGRLFNSDSSHYGLHLLPIECHVRIQKF